MTVTPGTKLTDLLAKKKRPIIYHQVNVTAWDSTLSLQIKTDNNNQSKLIIMARHDKVG